MRLWSAKIGQGELHAIAETLGSDVPVCLASETSWMEGRGERVSPAPSFAPIPAVLVNPGVGVPTGPVFGGLKSRSGADHAKPSSFASPDAVIAYLRTTGNDLEAPARAIAPVIGDVLDALASRDGVKLARMSGSGATCFGLFASEAVASEAARALKSAHPEWWVVATTVG